MSSDAPNPQISLRYARSTDAPELARVYIESWRESYAGLLPPSGLINMSMAHQTESWRRQVVYSGRTHAVIVAETKGYGLTGLASLGPARDRGLERYTGEVYALYVDPNYMGNGIGRALLRASFRLLTERGFGGAVIWALQGNNARYFYEAQGGKEIATRQGKLWGSRIQEVAFGWDNLAATLGGTTARRG